MSQWPPTSWARAWQQEEAHHVRAFQSSLLRPLLPLFFFCSFLATELWRSDTSSAKWLADKCVRRASGARGMETGGKACASWLKFKSTSQCEWKTERAKRQMIANHNSLKEHVRPSRAKSASQIPLSKRHPWVFCILPLSAPPSSTSSRGRFLGK